MRNARSLASASLVLVAVALMATADDALTAPAQRTARHPTSITISSKFPAFNGRVKSGHRACEKRRRVVLYRKTGGGGAKRLGTDRSAQSGRWVVRPDNLKSGAYYAKAKPKRKRRSICKAARSRVVVVD